ncbi:hypothetical protein [Shigella phage ESh27]|nr:hypothetical protein [Shigella phage ESh27]
MAVLVGQSRLGSFGSLCAFFSHKTVYMCFKRDIIDLSKQNNQIGEIKCLKLLTSSKLLKTL